MNTENLMTLLMMNGMKNNGTSNGNDDSINILYGFITMTIINYLVKILPQIGDFLKVNIEKLIQNFIENKRKQLLNDEISSIQLEFTDTYISSKCSALLNHITFINNAKNVKFNDKYTINNPKEFKLDYKDFMCNYSELEITTTDDRGNNKKYIKTIIVISSKENTIKDIREWIYSLELEYEEMKNNKLGDNRYYFSEVDSDLNSNNKSLKFSMIKFSTNKTLENIYGPEINEVNRLINLFINNPEWYVKRGLPHTLGFMLSGPPGTGKTSTIKAIANYTKRHIINLSLKPTTTQEELLDIFYSDNISLINHPQYNVVNIPQNKRLYVFEDIDCLSDIVLSRDSPEKKEEEKTENEKIEELKEINQKLEKEKENLIKEKEELKENIDNLLRGRKIDFKKEKKLINLSFLLNLLDGVIEIPNRLIIMTSNHPEKIDSALLRPGRVDLNIKYKLCDNNTILQMFKNFFDETELRQIDNKYSELLSPAKVTQIFSTYYDDSEKAFENLLKNLEEKFNEKIELI